MARSGWSFGFLLALAVLAAGLLVMGGGSDEPGPYERATVTVEAANGTALATVDVRIAETAEQRRIGLSRTADLPMGEGMLFVHERTGTYGYWMKNMSFGLDIVFVAADGEITRIHHAPVPEEIPGGNGNFEGTGRYVLEVPRGWANATGVRVGDRVEIPERAR